MSWSYSVSAVVMSSILVPSPVKEGHITWSIARVVLLLDQYEMDSMKFMKSMLKMEEAHFLSSSSFMPEYGRIVLRFAHNLSFARWCRLCLILLLSLFIEKILPVFQIQEAILICLQWMIDHSPAWMSSKPLGVKSAKSYISCFDTLQSWCPPLWTLQTVGTPSVQSSNPLVSNTLPRALFRILIFMKTIMHQPKQYLEPVNPNAIIIHDKM